MVFTHADVQNERRNLVEVVLDNRRSIMSLKQIEEDRDRGHNLGNVLLDNQANETDSDLGLDDRAPILERNFRPREKMGSGGSYSFGDWRGGSCANTAPNTSLFSKAAKEPAAHTTYSNAQSLGSSRNKHKGKTTLTDLDNKSSGPFTDRQGDEAKEITQEMAMTWGPLPPKLQPLKRSIRKEEMIRSTVCPTLKIPLSWTTRLITRK